MGQKEAFIELHLAVRAAFGGDVSASVVDQNLAHESCGDSHEVGAIFRVKRALVVEAQIRFVDQSSGLQSVVGTLALKITMGDGMEFVVDKRHKGVEGFFVSSPPLGEQFADGP